MRATDTQIFHSGNVKKGRWLSQKKSVKISLENSRRF